jgi:hypothetical protein
VLTPVQPGTGSVPEKPTAGSGTLVTPTLTLGHPSAVPGSPLSVVVDHCPASSLIQFTVDGTPAGQVRAGADGSYRGELTLPVLAVGPHAAQARCADVVTSTPVNLVVATASAASAGAAAATGAFALAFFVLIGSFLLRQDSPIGVRQRWSPDEENPETPEA